MRIVRLKEYLYIKNHLRSVSHITLDPYGPGVIRVHMVPPKTAYDRRIPYVLILNGQDILPIGVSWAILLQNFIEAMTPYDNRELTDERWNTLIQQAVTKTNEIYPALTEAFIRDELRKLLDILKKIAAGEKVSGKKGLMTLQQYAPHMTAPHRMDLMVSAMTRNGCWHCNQKCVHCYAAGQTGAEAKELSTEEWKLVLERLRKANIPQVTFTGGEPTLRSDLVELVDAAKWFVTRLNTNGRLLTKELCKALYNASLDSVQVTLYSADAAKHNQLVGVDGFDDTVQGIKNALEAGLNLSVNTPLCTVNRNYIRTLAFAHQLGVRYVTCSGLIPSGNALDESSAATALSREELKTLLQDAVSFCNLHHIEISFTSPGWLTQEDMEGIGLLQAPSCGACLSNMAIRPDGVVVPCQSWLSGDGLGNILQTPWKKIWTNTSCAEIRSQSAKMEGVCQLRERNKRGGDGR